MSSDRPHLIAWDSCNEQGLADLEFRYGTWRVRYALNLLERHQASSKSQYLRLNKVLDREIQVLRDLCTASPKSYIQLEGLDRLITYLAVKDSNDLALFWQKLIDLRQLPNRLWIILPSSLIPAHWPLERLHTIDQPITTHI